MAVAAPTDDDTVGYLAYVKDLSGGHLPVTCVSPSGLYTSGSKLRCEVTTPSGDTKFSHFWSFGPDSPIGPWKLALDSVENGSFFDVAMFYDEDCSLVAIPP